MELTYRLYLRTRSSDRDYFWVGDAPEEWWTDWGSSLLRRQPSLLRDTVDGRERIFLSRVVSARRDGSSSRTLVRYDLALEAEGRATPSGISSAKVDWLIDQWWSQRSLGVQNTWPLGEEIDRLLEADAAGKGLSVDDLLEQEGPDVRSAFRGLPDMTGPRPGEPDPEFDWVGSASRSTVSYLRRAPKLVHFVGTTPVDAQNGLELPEGVVIIVDGDAAEHRRKISRPLAPKVPAAPAPPQIERTHQIRLLAALLSAAVLLTAAVLLLLL